MKKFYITTPIYYVNDIPHIGHAYTTVAADVLARYKRMKGFEVFFLTGTDEHGQKVEKQAKLNGETPQELSDRVVENYRSLWKRLNISNDDFIRTTEERHKEAVVSLFMTIYKNGDIYKGEYEDWYCVPCETYLTELQLINDTCPECGRQVGKVKEESYFFRMSRYQEQLLNHINDHPDFIQPLSRRNEILSFIKSGLKDLSISRTGFKWGIPLPIDNQHLIYVWFDALSNYLTSTGYPDDMERFNRFWPADIHIMGKDIIRFHAVYWPAFLMSANIPLPEKVFSHGWWTIEGEKMSKSKSNVIDPAKVAERYGSDQFRYFLLREVPFGLDGDYSEEAFIDRINSDLANDLGNLLNRTLTMIERYCKGKIPPRIDGKDRDDIELSLIEKVNGLSFNVEHNMGNLQFHLVLFDIWSVINAANRSIEAASPWKEKQKETLSNFLYVLTETIRIISLYIYPFMPNSAMEILKQLGIDIDKHEWSLNGEWGGLKSDTQISKGCVLFPKIEKIEDQKRSAVSHDTVKITAQGVTSGSTDIQSKTNEITIKEFSKIDLKAGKVLEAERIIGSEKLLKLVIDIGREKRQVVAGIGKRYSPENIVDKKVILVANLKPTKIMGIKSEGMILAAGEKEVEGLATFDEDIKAGAKVR
ncbi:MAG: methionine--tRNA ligase [Nitrospirota bacterium]